MRAMDLKKSLGDLIRTRRLALGLSQEELGLRIGADQAYVSRIEGGRINLTLDTVDALAKALETDAASLLAGLKGP